MNVPAEILQTFLSESRMLLAHMEETLLHLEDTPHDHGLLDSLFRCVHTIKGSAGLFGFDHVVAFSHLVETLLARVRDSTVALDTPLFALLLECGDHLQTLIDAAAEQHGPPPETIATNTALAARLAAILGLERGAIVPAALQVRPDGVPVSSDDVWHVSMRFSNDLFRNGLMPTPVLRQLGRIGEIVHVTTLIDGMPAADAMDPESCYLGFEVRLRDAPDKATIEDAFEFVSEECELRILPPGSRVADYLRLIEMLPEENARLGELLVSCGALTQRELEQLLSTQRHERDGPSAARPLGEIAVERHAVASEVVDAALQRQQAIRQRQSSEAQLIRVQAAKLDALINQVGELVIASAGIGQMASSIGESGLLEAVSGMVRLIESIRESSMRLRMVEIGDTFTRFRRVVRDVARQLGKEIELQCSGVETELDKSLVEQITDPLTHLVRNAIDHGIETAEHRRAAGKPARGTLRLSAQHASGNVIIEVADDGAGLDRDRIIARARARGMLTPDAEPSDAEAWELIFEPGFSTAERVSDLSGRGVGMDVVRRNIEALRGSIEIDSTPGFGTTFRIRLPLTLAIIDGFLMGVGGSHYVVPLDRVIECVELEPGAAERGYLNLRGSVLPLLPLARHFGVADSDSRRRSVVIVSSGGRRAGLVVDRLEGEVQTVIKPLGAIFSCLSGIAGSTILGSGEVALVLDITALLGEASLGEHRSQTQNA